MFTVLKTEGKARRCEFETVHGTVQTPAFMNVVLDDKSITGIKIVVEPRDDKT